MRVNLRSRFDDDDEVDSAVLAAVLHALDDHDQQGRKVVVWKDGKPVWVDPSEFKEKDADNS